MRVPKRIVLALLWPMAVSGNVAWGQTAPQSGTLQVPPHKPHDQTVKAPMADPREPVHKVTRSSDEQASVTPPHAAVHPHKPASPPQAAHAKAAPVQPPPVVPAPAPAEVKTVQPEKLPDPEKPEGTVAKLPRFASLRSDDVNMRAGPGTRYRINWVYKRRDLPVEIEREFDVWRWVRDADGIQGWVHQATLMGRRSFIVENAEATMRSKPSETAAPVAVLTPGVIGWIRSCDAASDWCNVQTGSYRGYLRREQFWGTLREEAINP